MALTKMEYHKLQIMVETSPGVFVHHCLINLDRSMSKSTNWNSEVMPDCDDFDAPGKTVRTAESKDFTWSGSGKLDLGSVEFYDDWQESAAKKNVKVVLNPGTGGITYTGVGGLESFEVSGTYKNHADVNVSGFLEEYTKTVNT